MQGLWIGFALFVAFMLILMDVRLSSILGTLRELRDHFISEDYDSE